jgi:CheY-like chemotaxis protein
MTTSATAAGPDLAASVGANLPYLRRYARALTGNQTTGDRYAAATLEALLVDPTPMIDEADAKVGLFRTFYAIWSSAGAPLDTPDTTRAAAAQAHLAALTPRSREALLLQALEQFRDVEIARIMGVDVDEAAFLVETAIEEMQQSVSGRVMIIEDEAIIAMDIAAIVREMGHAVTGVAPTRAEAVALASRTPPDLILADIQLADKSSGIDAVNDILAQFGDIPVIFITAFPERLLTGERPEPAFLITKPYSEDQVRGAVSQAMFFASTETLVA